MAIVVIAGLMSSTLLTLVVIPVVYSLLHAARARIEAEVHDVTPRPRASRCTLSRRVTVLVLVRDGGGRRRDRHAPAPARAPPRGVAEQRRQRRDPRQRREPGRGPGDRSSARPRSSCGRSRASSASTRSRRPNDALASTSSSRRTSTSTSRRRRSATGSSGRALSWPPEVRRYRICRFNFATDLPIFQFGIVIAAAERRAHVPHRREDREAARGDPGRRAGPVPGPPRRPGPDLRRPGPRARRGRQPLRAHARARGRERRRVRRRDRGRRRPLHAEELRPVPGASRSSGTSPIRPGLKLGQIATIEPHEVRPRLLVALAHEPDALVPRPEGVFREHGRDVRPGARGAPSSGSWRTRG